MNSLWPYPGLRGRVFLDYPLDVLLNRQCSLKAHEAGLALLLSAYEAAARKLVSSDRKGQLLELMTEEQEQDWSYWASAIIMTWGVSVLPSIPVP